MTWSQEPSATAHAVEPSTAVTDRPTFAGPLVVAATDDGNAGAALRIAALLVRPDAVRVVSVVEPTATLDAWEAGALAAEADDEQLRRRRERVLEQQRAVLGDAAPDPEVRLGGPAELVARVADDLGASLVLTGWRHHDRLERMLLHRETPLAIVRRVPRPVLAVPPQANRLPRIALVAVDLDAACIGAARLARPLLADADTVYLVHVHDGGPPSLATPEHDRRYEMEVRANAARAEAALALPPEVCVETRVLRGDPVDELLDFAAYARVELVVAGYRKRTLTERVIGPRAVAERLFRGAGCMILLVPQSPQDAADAGSAAPAAAASDGALERARWSSELAAFGSRNVGRVARVQVAVPDGIPSASLEGFALADVAYDPSTDCLQLSFEHGDAGSPRGCGVLTHRIAHPVRIERLRGPEGGDAGLRVEHAETSTIVRLE